LDSYRYIGETGKAIRNHPEIVEIHFSSNHAGSVIKILLIFSSIFSAIF
jgi:hypothetical protein